MSTQKFKIEKVSRATRVRQEIDNNVVLDLFFNTEVNFIIQSNVMIIKSEHYGSEIKIPYEDIENKLASTDMSTYAAEICGLNYFNPNA